MQLRPRLLELHTATTEGMPYAARRESLTHKLQHAATSASPSSSDKFCSASASDVAGALSTGLHRLLSARAQRQPLLQSPRAARPPGPTALLAPTTRTVIGDTVRHSICVSDAPAPSHTAPLADLITRSPSLSPLRVSYQRSTELVERRNRQRPGR